MDEEASTTVTKIRRAKKLWLVGIPFLMIFILAAGLIYYNTNYGGHFPHKIRDQVHGVALFYPVNPPMGMMVDRSSFKVPAKNVVTYIVKDTQGNIFYVSVEALPQNFDFSTFKTKFETTSEFITHSNSVLIGDLGAQLVGSIQTPQNSWIIVNTSDINANKELEALCRTFIPTR